MATYTAYSYGKMNQSFIMKDSNNQSVYEANLVKFKLFGDSDFEFINKKTLKTEPHKIGKTKTIQSRVSIFNFYVNSYFKLDGVNVFDKIRTEGFAFKFVVKLDFVHPEFALLDSNGNQIATYKLNVLGEKQENVVAIGSKQRNTIITTDSSNLDIVFLGAFILNRVDFSDNLT